MLCCLRSRRRRTRHGGRDGVAIAAVAAGSPPGFWRMSGHPAVQQALRNHYFDSLGLLDFMFLIKLNLIEPPGT
jgi:hypothetical protein